MMHFQESETVELTAIFIDDIKKEIISFANCNGGTLYIGVQDDGTIIGLENPDQVALQISNMVRDTIKPDITMFLHYETMMEADKQIVAVKIQRGTNRPYYIAKKGIRPEGVYVRQGYSSVPATDAAIRNMIKETDGDRFESMRSLYQDLTFLSAQQQFKLRGLEFGRQQMRSLKLLDQDGLFNNLGLLLSDQCMHTLKTAVFQGKDQTVFKDRREFSGSLLKQMNDAYNYIDLHNQTHATVEKLIRIDVRDYPEIAIRESLLNLLVHRDYSFSASAFINIYTDRIEFISIGGLMPGIELDDVMMGISICRNQELANIFYRLHLIESYGTGIRKIMKAYEGSNRLPIIEATKNAFKVILPSINETYDEPSSTTKHRQMHSDSFDYEEEKVLEYVKVHKDITRKDVIQLLQVSSSTASRLLRKMVDLQLLKPIGRARKTKYNLFNK